MKIKAIILMFSIFLPITLFAANPTCPLASGLNVHTKKRVLSIVKMVV